MIAIDDSVLKMARQLIARDIGDMSDLLTDIRNTIANVYYEFSAMQNELNRPNAWPTAFALAGDLKKGVERFAESAAFLQAATEAMPDIVRGIRQFDEEGNSKGVELTLTLFRDMFKYRIPGATTKPSIWLAVERCYYGCRVREIPNLWKLI